MKSTLQLSLFTIFLSLTTSFLRAQSVCMVTADFVTGEDYIVIWEPFADNSGLDSVIVYRQQGTETVFSKIGSVKIGENENTHYTDVNANTMDSTKYAISILDSSGVESPRSLYHQPVLLDYFGAGQLDWTPYYIEDQIDDSYIYGYIFKRDISGLGFFEQLLWQDTTGYIDGQYLLEPNSRYLVDTQLPNCNFTKANINTSRSNIKQQFSNASVGIDEKKILVSIQPNPAQDELTIHYSQALSNATVWICDIEGNQVYKNQSNGDHLTISIQGLSSGSYFINTLNNGRVSTVKFIKQ